MVRQEKEAIRSRTKLQDKAHLDSVRLRNERMERLNRLQGIAVAVALIALAIQAAGIGGIPYIALGLALSFALYGYLRKTVKASSIAGFETLSSSDPAQKSKGWRGACSALPEQQGARSHAHTRPPRLTQGTRTGPPRSRGATVPRGRATWCSRPHTLRVHVRTAGTLSAHAAQKMATGSAPAVSPKK